MKFRSHKEWRRIARKYQRKKRRTLQQESLQQLQTENDDQDLGK